MANGCATCLLRPAGFAERGETFPVSSECRIGVKGIIGARSVSVIWPEFRLAVFRMTMSLNRLWTCAIILVVLSAILSGSDLCAAEVVERATIASSPAEGVRSYRLAPNDIVRVKVFQEDD